ncbi:MAG: dienelactone hydrolase family protein [Chthoniobacterales bacterium]
MKIFIVFLLMGMTGAFGQEWAKAKLEKSQRHGEWVEVTGADGRKVRAFIVYPEVSKKATAVIVIHEIFGLTDWVRGVCDDLAAAGYIAIAPDLLSGKTYEGIDEVRKAISQLKPEQITSDINALANYVTKLPAANGKLAIAGFCWGGGQAFSYAAANPGVKASFVFYGSAPASEEMAKIVCPVYGFYGENDARISAGIPDTEKAMKAAGRTYEPVIYSGAGHGFMRTGEAPDAKDADRKAREEAWKRLTSVLSKISS